MTARSNHIWAVFVIDMQFVQSADQFSKPETDLDLRINEWWAICFILFGFDLLRDSLPVAGKHLARRVLDMWYEIIINHSNYSSFCHISSAAKDSPSQTAVVEIFSKISIGNRDIWYEKTRGRDIWYGKRNP
jgi:hypothetical protein